MNISTVPCGIYDMICDMVNMGNLQNISHRRIWQTKLTMIVGLNFSNTEVFIDKNTLNWW